MTHRFGTAALGLATLLAFSAPAGAATELLVYTALEADQISTVLKKARNGDPGNIWYIDHMTRTVFEGQALGARYSAGGIAQRCISNEAYQARQTQRQAEEQQLKQSIGGLR